MKTVICLVFMLALANYAQSAVANCPLASYCQSCGSGATTCSSCLSYAYGTTLANKTWASSSGTACTGAIPTTWVVTDCLYNMNNWTNSQLNPSTVVAVTNHPRCQVCNSKKFLYYSNAATTETCSDTAPTAMSTCLEITNCAQTVCKTDATTAYYCVYCNAGYYPTGISTSTTYNTTCGSVTTAITNCSVYTHSVVSSTISYFCGKCASGYAVSSAGTSCIAYSVAGCQQLQSDGINCATCLPGYYFNTSTCVNTNITAVTTTTTTKSYVIALVSLISFVSLMLMQ